MLTTTCVSRFLLWVAIAGPALALDCGRLQSMDPEVFRIAQLRGSPQEAALRALLAKDVSSESVFYYGDRLRPALRSLVQDGQVGEAAARLLTLIAVPEDVRAVIESPPQPLKMAFASRWAYDAATSLLHPDSDVEWSFLRRCALNELNDLWADAGAIQTIKLIASPRSRELLEEVQRRNPFRIGSVRRALQYIDSEPAPLIGSDLVALTQRVAHIIAIGEWKGNAPALCDESGENALVAFIFETASDRFIYVGTFHRSASMWELRGVRETEQEMLGLPILLKKHNPKN